MSPTHTHFCWKCFGTGGGTAPSHGWWKCNAAHCTREQADLCKYHRELGARRSPEDRGEG